MMGSNANRYSPEEDAVLREVYEKNLMLKAQMHRLPGRSYEAAVQRALYLGLSKKTMMDRIHELMADGEPRTAAAIERLLGGRRKYIVEQLRLASNGVDYHICSYVGVGRNFVFKAGPGVNAVRPEPMHIPLKVYQQRRRAKSHPTNLPVTKFVRPKAEPRAAKPKRVQVDDRTKDEKYRLPATRWPKYDLTAFEIITSMIRDARQSA